MAKVQDCSLDASRFELHLRYNIYFRINTFRKGKFRHIYQAISLISLQNYKDSFGIE